MIRISCFKHEKEILLYSQTLPIQSTKTFEKDDEILVEHLIGSLISTEREIVDSQAFYRQIGIQFKAYWWSLIISHPSLETITGYEEKTVLQRFTEELDIESETGEIWSDWKPIRGLLNEGIFGLITNKGSQFIITGSESTVNIMLCKLVYTVQIDDVFSGQEYEFGVDGHFDAAIFAPPREMHIIRVGVKPKSPSSGHFLFLPAYEHGPFPKYRIQQEMPIHIDSVVKIAKFSSENKEGGTMQVFSASDIIIMQQGHVDADGTGLMTEDDCICYDQYMERRVSQQIVTNEFAQLLSIDSFSNHHDDMAQEENTMEPGRGGGIVTLQTTKHLSNYGVLSSNASTSSGYQGGTIIVCAEGAVMNYGEIQCIPNGRITVRCRQFVNEGLILPAPQVLITDGTEQREIEMVVMPWCANKMETIPLSFHSHRGHFGNFHPQNLLDIKGTGTHYVGNVPGEGDWIIFEIESPFIVIPNAVLIRNDYCAAGVKTVGLSLATAGRVGPGTFERFAVIENVSNDNVDAQMLELEDVKMSNAQIWMNGYKFIKLEVISNWGWTNNTMYGFGLFGAMTSDLRK